MFRKGHQRYEPCVTPQHCNSSRAGPYQDQHQQQQHPCQIGVSQQHALQANNTQSQLPPSCNSLVSSGSPHLYKEGAAAGYAGNQTATALAPFAGVPSAHPSQSLPPQASTVPPAASLTSAGSSPAALPIAAAIALTRRASARSRSSGLKPLISAGASLGSIGGTAGEGYHHSTIDLHPAEHHVYHVAHDKVTRGGADMGHEHAMVKSTWRDTAGAAAASLAGPMSRVQQQWALVRMPGSGTVLWAWRRAVLAVKYNKAVAWAVVTVMCVLLAWLIGSLVPYLTQVGQLS